MNKLNYLLAPVIIILLIGNIFLYFNLSKQNFDIKKDISEIKSGLDKQQANAENLQNLVTFNWKEYANEKFGLTFKYPDYVNICDETANYGGSEKMELILGIRPNEACTVNGIPASDITIKKNIENYKTTEEAFNKELLKDYTTPDTSYTKELQKAYESIIKTNFTYFKIGGLDAFGGEIVSTKPSSDPLITSSSGYKAIILKNNYIIKFSGGSEQIIEGKEIGDKPVFDAMVSSFYFNSSGLLK